MVSLLTLLQLYRCKLVIVQELLFYISADGISYWMMFLISYNRVKALPWIDSSFSLALSISGIPTPLLMSQSLSVRGVIFRNRYPQLSCLSLRLSLELIWRFVWSSDLKLTRAYHGLTTFYQTLRFSTRWRHCIQHLQCLQLRMFSALVPLALAQHCCLCFASQISLSCHCPFYSFVLSYLVLVLFCLQFRVSYRPCIFAIG